MKKLIIFGITDAAELAHFYFENDTDYTVCAFCVDSSYVPEDRKFCGLPVVPFEEVTEHYPPDQYTLFIALGYSKINQIRTEKYVAAKALGYTLASYISSKATVLNNNHIGDNCFILEDNTIQPFVKIGNNVTMWSGNHIGHHSVIDDHCFLASHIVVSGHCHIKEACFVGVNATFRDHITIGEKCVIGAGTIILGDAESSGVYISTPTERSRLPSNKLRKI